MNQGIDDQEFAQFVDNPDTLEVDVICNFGMYVNLLKFWNFRYMHWNFISNSSIFKRDFISNSNLNRISIDKKKIFYLFQ